MGHSALEANTTGASNTAIGKNSLASNTTASNNTAVGKSALVANTTGASNVAIGKDALDSNTTASNNTAVGMDALQANTSGEYNSSLGRSAAESITTGVRHTAIGYNAAQGLVTGTGGIYLGMDSAPSADDNNYEIVIGYNTTGKGGQTGYINPIGGGVYQGNNATTWSTTSDRRIKKDIVDNNTGLEKIKGIQIRNFEYRTEDEITDFDNPKSAVVEREGIQLGVIAQEIKEILPDVVKTEDTGVMTVNADNITWYLVNAVKELSAEVEELKSKSHEKCDK